MSLCGWKKTPSGGEIDFVIKCGEGTFPLECKASLTFDRKNTRGIADYLEMYRQPIGVVASLAPQAVFTLDEDRRVVNLPLYLLERLPRVMQQYASDS